uniref:Uncharacterized protein n=1 Tax=Eutreptiella gymnastica TaxID=73025 RepID=A0A7S1I4X7_9EUGL
MRAAPEYSPLRGRVLQSGALRRWARPGKASTGGVPPSLVIGLWWGPSGMSRHALHCPAPCPFLSQGVRYMCWWVIAGEQDWAQRCGGGCGPFHVGVGLMM